MKLKPRILRRAMKTAVAGLIFLLAGDAFASNQIEERVEYDGAEWTIRAVHEGDGYAWPYFPFEDYLKMKRLSFRSAIGDAYTKQSQLFTNGCGAVAGPWTGFSTACTRGYVARWKIEKDRLYLIAIGNPFLLYRIPLDPPSIEACPLVVFDPAWESPVFADWVTKKVMLTAQETRGDVRLDGCSEALDVQIEKGIVKAAQEENPLFTLSVFASYQADRERRLNALKPAAIAFKPLVLRAEITRFYEKVKTLRRGMTPEEVEAKLGKPDEISVWEPKPMRADDAWFKDKNIKDVPAFVDAQNRNRINVCTYNTRYYFYKEMPGKYDGQRDICMTLLFRFDNYPDTSKRSLKEVR